MVKNQSMKKAFFLDRDGVLNKAFVVDGLPYPPKSCVVPYHEFHVLVLPTPQEVSKFLLGQDS